MAYRVGIGGHLWVKVVELVCTGNLLDERIRAGQWNPLSHILQLIVIISVINPSGTLLNGIDEPKVLASEVIPAKEPFGGKFHALLVCRREVVSISAYVVR